MCFYREHKFLTCQRGGVLSIFCFILAARRRTPCAGMSLSPVPTFAAASSRPLTMKSNPCGTKGERIRATTDMLFTCHNIQSYHTYEYSKLRNCVLCASSSQKREHCNIVSFWELGEARMIPGSGVPGNPLTVGAGGGAVLLLYQRIRPWAYTSSVP